MGEQAREKERGMKSADSDIGIFVEFNSNSH